MDHNELAALTRALDLLGFDAGKLAATMLGPEDEAWKARCLTAVRVELDRRAAMEADPSLGAAGIQACEAWLASVRREPTPQGELVRCLRLRPDGARVLRAEVCGTLPWGAA